MPNKLSIFKFVRTVVIGTVLIGLLFGTVGFLIAGRVGFENMFIFGLAIGLIIVLVLSFAMVIQAYSSETFGNTRFKLL